MKKINKLFRSVYWSVYWTLHPKRNSRVAYLCSRHWCVYRLRDLDNYCTPSLDQIWRGSAKYRKEKLNRYTCRGFVEIEPCDIVVEVGGFIGEFTKPASSMCKKVIVLEPDKKNMECLMHNTKKNKNIEYESLLAYDEEREIDMIKGEDPSDHSVVNIDSGKVSSVDNVSAVRLDKLIKRKGIKEIDFLKVDAEGAEPEVMRGASGIHIRKCSIDCGPERNEKKTKQKIIEMLKNRDMEVRTGGIKSNIVFGKIRKY